MVRPIVSGVVRQDTVPEEGASTPGDAQAEVDLEGLGGNEEGEGTADSPSIGVIGSYDQYFLENRPIRYTGSTGGSVDPVSQFLYFDGDEWNLFQNRSAEYIASIQRQFVAAGLLDPSEITDGRWRAGEAGIMRQLMDIGNASNNAWSTIFGEYQRSGASRPTGGGRRGSGGAKAPTIRLSNPDDLRKVFRETARAVTGGVFVEDAQIDEMVKAFQGKEAAFQRKAIAGGTVTDPPSAQTFAEGRLEDLDSQGAEANRFAQMASVLEQMTAGG